MIQQRRSRPHPEPARPVTPSLLGRQSELPRSVPLFRYAPERVHFPWRDWDPALVRSCADLPQYLILGSLDPSTFEVNTGGWSARWQGTESDTCLEVTFKRDTSRWEIRQTWCGLDGGFSGYPARIPLDRVIGQALYTSFPRSWDRAAKLQIESAYQVSVVEEPEHAFTFCGIPDGAFRTIIFPIPVRNLRPMQEWMRELVQESPPAYPITVDAKLLLQVLNYVEGKAPAWTAQEAVAFNLSVVETGLAPLGLPVREVASDGSAAWTMRRELYFLFIGLPFAGLTDFLGRMARSDGPIRRVTDPDFRFELRPIVMPASLEVQTESLALWDKPRATRSFVQFTPPGHGKTVPTVEQLVEADRAAPATLAKIESISGDVVTAIEQIFQRVMKGGAA